MSWQQPPGGPPPDPNGGWGHPPRGQRADAWAPTQPVPMHGQAPRDSLRPDRSALVLVLSLSSLMVMFFGCTMCGPMSLGSLGLSIPAIVMARRDLAAIDAGTMVGTGRDATNVGMIIAIVSTVLSALIGIAMVVLMILYGGLIGAALLLEG